MKTNKVLAALALLACLIFMGCNGKGNNEIQPGDLLFVALPMNYTIGDSTADADASSNELNFIHAAILDVDKDGEIWVIDATIKHGVDRHPLDTFLVDFTLKDGDFPTLKVMRLKDNANAKDYVKNAEQWIGEPYDVEFKQDNDSHYCTELIYDAYADDNKHIFSLEPMDFRYDKGQIPTYWHELFGILDKEVPQGDIGILPFQMCKENCLKEIDTDIIDTYR